MGRGGGFQLLSFGLLCASAVLALGGAIFGFWGSRISDRGYWETVRLLTTDVQAARRRQEPKWTPFVQVKSNGFPALPEPMTALLQFQLHSDDNTVPLIVRVAADKDGHYSNTVAGPAGVVEQLITEPQTYYVSVSHPSIKWSAHVLGWKDRRGR